MHPAPHHKAFAVNDDDTFIERYLETQNNRPARRLMAGYWLVLLMLAPVLGGYWVLHGPASASSAAYELPWDSVFPVPVQAVYFGDALPCNDSAMGVMRYGTAGDLQLCHKGAWVSIRPSSRS